MTNAFFNIAGRRIERELDRLWLNQRAGASNLANLNTPGYRGYRLVDDTSSDFESLLGEQMARTDDGHLGFLPGTEPVEFRRETVEEMSPDTELADLSKNQMFYQTLLEVVVRRDRMARTALEGR